MKSNSESAWEKFSKQVDGILNNPEKFKFPEVSKHYYPILHLWIKPTFTVATHWLFYKPFQHINPWPKSRVLKISWDEKNDLERFTSGNILDLEPSFIIEITEIDSSSLKNILNSFKKIHLPVFQSTEFFGRDGDTYGAETFGIQNAKISWHEGASEEWEELNKVFLETIDILNTMFAV